LQAAVDRRRGRASADARPRTTRRSAGTRVFHRRGHGRAARLASLDINIELASPSDFIPEVPGWRDRSRVIQREGPLDFYHYGFYAQCLSKIERGHATDRADVASMIGAGLVDRRRLGELFAAIEPELYRYPAIDAADFRRRVDAITGDGN
jgi:hypothetical protein